MKLSINRTDKNKMQSIAASLNDKTVQSKAIELQDNRPVSILQRKINNTGLPGNIKSGIENLSGHSMDDVKVHYNSDQPSQLAAHAYAQGKDIHIAPGQEKHLAHEAWHVVQQKQGRVRRTIQLKEKVNVNDDKGLEQDADLMGAKAQSPVPVPSMQLKEVSFYPVVQGKFILEGKRTLTPQQVFDLVRGKVKYPEAKLLRAIEKLEEGPDIHVDAPEHLIEILSVKLGENEGQLEAPKDSDNAQWRKINRITGLIEAKLKGLGDIPASAEPLIRGFSDALLMIKDVLDINKVHYDLVIGTLDNALKNLGDVKGYLESGKDSRFMWQIYSIISQLGPFAHAIHQVFVLGGYPNEAVIGKYKDHIMADLRQIRQLMAQNIRGITVVAHRGHGPTNRTMGGLIQEGDQRRKNRPAENSPEAFESAFMHVPGGRAERKEEKKEGKAAASSSSSASEIPPGLDGVECDVYLSRDNVPMLSHEGNIKEQLSAAMKKHLSGVKGREEVHDRSAKELVAISRTGRKKSGFMTLEDLLNMCVPVADGYYRATGKAFRIEVEMKGAKVHGRGDLMRRAVAKVVSQFHKRFPALPVEIILFNGDAEQVKSYAGLRNQKTALGGIYTGFNFKGEDVDPRHVDELRAMIAGVAKVPELLKHFIVTLVFGQELVPEVLKGALGSVEPSMPLLYDRRPKKHPLGQKEMLSELKSLEALYALIQPAENEELIQKLHLLTDYPAKAAWLKSAKHIRDEIISLKKKIAFL